MNLNGVVSGIIGIVNPNVTVTVRTSAGYTTSPDGTRVPNYTNLTLQAQMQSLQYNDLALLDSLQIQGIRRAFYFTGDIEGIIRISQKGGDLITLPDGTVWLAAIVLEKWPDWTKVAATLQDGS